MDIVMKLGQDYITVSFNEYIKSHVRHNDWRNCTEGKTAQSLPVFMGSVLVVCGGVLLSKS